MEINLKTKIATILDEYPYLEQTLIELSPAFAKLKNPVLRRTIAKITDISQAAKIAGISPVFMLDKLCMDAGLSIDSKFQANKNDENSEKQPEWFDENKIFIRFNATEIINSGKSPTA